jgi:Zn-dependent protease/CBS domain-containing protein
MSGTFQLGRIFGIYIRLHFSWLFIFVLVAWILADSFLPDFTERNNYPSWSTSTYWTIGVIGSLLLFTSVLVHELSHSLLAISRGYKVSGITLFFLGGVSEIQEEAVKASEEFWIAIVGPLSSVVLAALFWVLLQLVEGNNSQAEAIFSYLATINLALAVFNLVPAFPLDGGRVLKAVIWQATGNISRANAIAISAGSLLGFTIIGIGVLIVVVTRNIAGVWWVLIGWFIQSAASSSRQQYHVQTALSGLTVRDAMQEEVPTVEPGVTVQELLEEYVTKEFQRVYLVSLADNFQGLVSVSDIKQVSPEERPTKFVTEIMTRAPDVVAVSPSDPLETALERLTTNDVNQLVVLENGRPEGLINRRDILSVLEISELFPNRPASS